MYATSIESTSPTRLACHARKSTRPFLERGFSKKVENERSYMKKARDNNSLSFRFHHVSLNLKKCSRVTAGLMALFLGLSSCGRLTNLSTRAFVQTDDNVIIGGFIVQGTEPKRVIIRAIGPELTQYGVPNVLANPTLELHDGTGSLIASNNNWATTIIGGIITATQVRDIMNSGHAPTDGLESAIIADLPPGNYTAIVRGVNRTMGVALVEVYDLTLVGSSLVNISTRAFVQTGDNVMIGGFVIRGGTPERVIVRAIGPELTQHGVPNVLADPTLELHDGTGALIATNDDWQTTILGGIITTDQVSDIRNSGHAPTDVSESAIIADLRPGNYTAIVRGVNSTTGVALVEVYAIGETVTTYSGEEEATDNKQGND